ncbi:MAG: hypothetical protein JWO98_4876 [Frankiales bacterium]|nr:hypothetical protein [Frankiales bacterium]
MTVPATPADPSEEAAAPPARPSLRLVRVRTPQPPVDTSGPLRLILPGVAPPRPAHRPGPRPGTAARRVAPGADFGTVWSTRSDLPDPRDAGRRVLTTVLEVLAGRRPVAQLGRLTAPGVLAALAAGRRPGWCSQGTAPIVLGRVHVCEPVDGVAEVSAVAHRAGRAHAVAARLEGLDGRWRCTAVRIG